MQIGKRHKAAAGLAAVAVVGAIAAYGVSDLGAKHTTADVQTVTAADPPSGPNPSPSTAPSGPASPSPSPSASASASASISASPSPGHSAPGTVAPASTRPGTTTAKSAPAPAPAPVAKAGPVAPPPPPVAPQQTPPAQGGCKSFNGTNQPQSAVGSALTAAAGKSRTLTLSSGGTDKLPPLPVNLVKAIAWQESGWQSAIQACDGGIGTMQLMPATVTWMNGKFGTKNDVQTLAGNTDLGAELLDELVAYYGDSDFGGKYDLTPDPVTGKNPLLDVVVAAYNAGAGNVHYNTTSTTDPTTGVTTVTGAEVIPNPSYVTSVEALMTNCSCLH
ncbi:soluble lytic murein transglycosylase-like protein [Kitasatospora sp. MAP12-15]|uniref:transglycosylase SLT domain-containing protein n=1 Tax=unclassified Kitasatospora TaxID=2633591 RepID=UPI0024745BDC|nr:transglycosylase SLT domain-containing protein [Kitasatospora sp. MAP12-44]MDH6110171.1 soluble lytic murein transglycosylase-like protein [Kitasatospora sp. MAP12-44]